MEPEVAVKLCRFVKAVPSVLTLNTVPLPAVPPPFAVPKSVLPDTINPPYGPAPSVPAKLWRFVKVCAGTRPASIKPTPAVSRGMRNRFLTGILMDQGLLTRRRILAERVVF
jgi:hypothetical protein